MISILNRILGLVPGDGLKTVIAAVIIVVGGIAGIVAELIPVVEYSALNTLLDTLKTVLEWLHGFAELFGIPFLTVGVAHKGIKALDE